MVDRIVASQGDALGGAIPLSIVGDALKGVACVLDPAQEGVQGHVVVPVWVDHMVQANAAPLC